MHKQWLKEAEIIKSSMKCNNKKYNSRITIWQYNMITRKYYLRRYKTGTVPVLTALKPRLFRLYMRTHPDVLNSCLTWRVECQWCSTGLRGVLGGGSFKWTCREPCFHTTGAELPPSRLIIPIHTSNCLAGKTVPAIVDGVVRTSEVGHYSWCSAKGLRGARSVRGGGKQNTLWHFCPHWTSLAGLAIV